MYKVQLDFPSENYLNDVQDVPKEFSPYLEIDSNSPNYLGWDFSYKDKVFKMNIFSDIFGNYENSFNIDNENQLDYKRYTKHFVKNCLYAFLSEKLDIVLPYGSLTGVRPTKLYYQLMHKKLMPEHYLMEEYKVTKEKIKLISDCISNQKGIINTNPSSIALFLNIPFCPTRCSYCSFISTEIFRVEKELPTYIHNVIAEIEDFKEFLSKTDYKLTSVYVGGGTPTCIGVEMLDKLLKSLSSFGVEFTVEAGRPDTINEEMLDMLRENNVTRISINPQSFHQKTLEKIKRKHSVDEIYKCYNLAKEKGFVINMDLISMLQDETYQDFCYSVDETIRLNPHNITIHTLSLKRGSPLTEAGDKKQEFGKAIKMNDYAYNALYSAGYKPYYMYRQKSMADNLENISFFRDNYQCKYNIDMMEESSSIYGIGAGAMSKNIDLNKTLARLANPKGFREYIDRISSIIQNKRDFFKF